MKTLGVVMGAVLLCLASPVAADPRDSVDRGNRLDTDAIRDDVRTNRLEIPHHPLAAEQPQVQPGPAATSKAKPKKSKKYGDVH